MSVDGADDGEAGVGERRSYSDLWNISVRLLELILIGVSVSSCRRVTEFLMRPGTLVLAHFILRSFVGTLMLLTTCCRIAGRRLGLLFELLSNCVVCTRCLGEVLKAKWKVVGVASVIVTLRGTSGLLRGQFDGWHLCIWLVTGQVPVRGTRILVPMNFTFVRAVVSVTLVWVCVLLLPWIVVMNDLVTSERVCRVYTLEIGPVL